MHRVGARRKRLAGLAAIRRIAGVLAVDHIARDGQDRLCMDRVAIGWKLADLLHEGRDEVSRNTINPVVVVAVFREIARYLVGDDQPVLAADWPDLRVLDRRETVSHNR